MQGLAALDWVVIGLYFLVLVGIVWWSARKQKTSEDYFLASRNLGWFVIGASVFASNIGSEHLVGLAGAGASSGMAMAHYELHAWCVLVLGWVLVPFYARSMVYTMPEFLERRYSPASRWMLSVISLVAYVFTKVAVALYAGGIVFKALFPEPVIAGLDNFWLGSILVVVFTGIYTVLGGLRAVVYTDTVQAVVLIFGSLLVTIFGLNAIGGWGALRDACGSDFFNLWKPFSSADPSVPWYANTNFPWPGMLLCAPIVGLWYWCTDQYIVQRVLGAPDEKTARRSTIWAGFLKLSPVFLFIIPGMIALALAKTGGEGFAMLEVKDGVAGNSGVAYPLLVKNLLPIGVRGIVVAGLLAALMSSLSSVFNASSTLFTKDIYQKLRPNASERHLVWVGRLATGAMVVFGLAWIPLMKFISSTLYVYLQAVQAYIAPPIFAVFFLGVFFKRINAKGCMAGLIGGFVIGMLRLVAEICKTSLEGTSMYWFANMFFQYFALLLLMICVALIVGVSLLTAPPSDEQINGLTYATTSAEDKDKSRRSWGKKEVIASGVVLAMILAVYVYFRG